MRRGLLAAGLGLVILGLGITVYFIANRPRPPVETKFVQKERRDIGQNSSVPISSDGNSLTDAEGGVVSAGESALLDNPRHVYQTFNNCGPATLSMILSYYGTNVSQEELADLLRPYRNPQGDNDDKNIFTHEFTGAAEQYGYRAIARVNGDIELLKIFTANGIPVVVKTWLNVDDDIGHFRVVRGFDERSGVIIQDDSYHGPNKRIPYYDFLSMWQPFNYVYIIVYTPDMEGKIFSIIGDELDEEVAWERALVRAEKERELTPDNPYPIFNISASSYYLGDYERTVLLFEELESSLPRRMLWYQIEPILAYQNLGRYDRVFSIIDRILGGGNRAFSELYYIRGQVYFEQGDVRKAREEFERAVFYNRNYEQARAALNAL
jgi:tetratricopeptide (TPR) repeat protein